MEGTIIETQNIEIQRFQLFFEDGRLFEIERKYNYMLEDIDWKIYQQNPINQIMPGDPEYYEIVNRIKQELEK